MFVRLLCYLPLQIPAGLKPMKKKNDDMDDIFAGLGKKVKMQGKGKVRESQTVCGLSGRCCVGPVILGLQAV